MLYITKTPVRISLLGGGTDYPEYFNKHEGRTIGFAINKYSYITVKKITTKTDYKYRISYSRTELVDNIDEIQHPSVKACLKYLKITDPLEITYIGDLPAGTGLGSSSSFTVGLLNALYAINEINRPQREIAEDAIYVERSIIKENVGLQDQYTCALGGLIDIQYKRNQIEIYNNVISDDILSYLCSKLLLFYTGIKRLANEILDEQMKNTNMGVIDDELSKMKELVKEGIEILKNKKDIDNFGRLLNKNWQYKKKLSNKITNQIIDEYYNKAIDKGALGGKLLGAGGGGFLLVYANEDSHEKIRHELKEIKEIEFKVEKKGTTRFKIC